MSGLGTKEEIVNLALEEFIKNKKRFEARALFGKIDFDKNWDPRKLRGKI
jgi:hypothetical protein